MPDRRALFGRDTLYLVLIAALPVIGYRFGLGNQLEQFSLIERLSDPHFLTGDFFVNSSAGFGPRYYYALMISWLTKIAPLPAVIFALTVATNLALAAISFDAAKQHLRADDMAGAICALLVIANGSFSLGFAGYLHFDSYQPASLAIPLALLGLSSLVASRRFIAAGAFAASSLFHPLIGVEAGAISYMACGLVEVLRARTSIASLRALSSYIPSGLFFCAAVFLAWALPSIGTPGARIPDAEFFGILARFRAPHHYLAGAQSPVHYFTALLFVISLGYFARHHFRENGARFEAIALTAAACLVIVFCAASVIFVDFLHNRAFVTAQLFRMLLIVKWVGYLFFAWAASRWIIKGGLFHWAAALAPVIASAEAQPVVMAGAIVAVEMAARMKLNTMAFQLAATILSLFAVILGYKIGAGKESLRAAAGCVCLWLLFGPAGNRVVLRSAAIALIAILITFGLVNRDARLIASEAFVPAYSWGDVKGPDADIARWAKANTPKDSVWLTPPEFESFRVLAERAVVVDFTSIPFGDMPMREWKARMTALYGDVSSTSFQALRDMQDNYRRSDPEHLRQAAELYGASYAVLYAETDWPGRVLYSNGEYKAVQPSKVDTR